MSDTRSRMSGGGALSTPEISDNDSQSPMDQGSIAKATNNKTRKCPDIDLVVEAVDYWQTRKAKPDAKKINTYIAKFWPSHCREDPGLVDRLIEESLSQGMIVVVENNEQQSYRTPSKIGRMIRMTKILPYKGEIPMVVVHKVMRAIGSMEYVHQRQNPDGSDKGTGVEAEALIMYLHRSLVLLNYSLEMLEKRVLPTAIKLSFATMIGNRRYTLTPSYREKHGIVFRARVKQEDDDDDAQENIDSGDDSKDHTSMSYESSPELNNSKVAITKVSKAQNSRRSKPEPSPTPMIISNDEHSNSEIESKNTIDKKLVINNSEASSVQPQRVSTRKRVKKSLGPDFLEEPEHLLFYIKETNAVSKCIVCGSNVPRPKLRRTTSFISQSDVEPCDPIVLSCNSCQNKAHINCVQLLGPVGVKFQWTCGTCEVCSVCKQKKPKDFIIKCRVCQKGFHTSCTKIVKNTSTSNDKGWECSSCFAANSRLSASPSSSINNPNSLLNKSQTSPIRKTNSTIGSSTAVKTGMKIIHQPIDPKISQKRKIISSSSSSFKQQNNSLLQSTNDSSSSANNDQTTSNSILNNSNNSPSTASKSLLISRGGGGGQSMIKEKSMFAQKNSTTTSNTANNGKSLMMDGSAQSILKCPEIRNLLLGNIGKDIDNSSNDREAIELITMDEDDEQQQPQSQRINNENIANNHSKWNLSPRSGRQSNPPSLVKQSRKFDLKRPGVRYNFQYWLQNELQIYLKKDLSSLYRLPNKVADWDSDDVKLFAEAVCSKQIGQILKDEEFDGVSLLVLQRRDIIHSLGLELGYATKFYHILARLQSADCFGISCE